MTKTLANQVPRINLANGGSMQSARVVTLKSGQQNRFLGWRKIANALIRASMAVDSLTGTPAFYFRQPTHFAQAG